MIRVRIESAAARRKLKKIGDGLTPEAIDPVIDRVAVETLGQLIRETPKKWFGQVRRGWIVTKPGPGQRIITNQNKIMLFLEEGTRDHGPATAITGPLLPGQERGGKKALFIPLTRRAVGATAGAFGVGFVPIKAASKNFMGPVVHGRGIIQRTESVRKGRKRVGSRNLIYGRDYVLAKRVKGIKAMHIVRTQRRKTRTRLVRALNAHVRAVIQKAQNG